MVDTVMKLAPLSFFTLFAYSSTLFGQTSQGDSFALSAQVSALKEKSLVHEKEIEALLSSKPLEPTKFNPPVSGAVVPPEPDASGNQVPPSPYLPVPDYYETKEPVSPPDAIPSSKTNDIPSSTTNLSETSDVLDLNSSDSQGDENENEDRVADVLIERHDGYYFGPLLGFVIPDDGAVRNLVNNTKESFESDAGYFIGLQFGKDFGTIRWEVEYSHHGFDGQGSGTDYEISVHDFMTRLLLEKEIGDLIDLRAGLGMGIGFISIEDNQDYSGESFVYDFGVGASYRLRENMNLSLDYRYFLSAAEDQYDRLKGHIFTASANFDL